MPSPAATLDPADLITPALARFGALTAAGRRMREQLGLPTDKPVIMSGHQLAFWHPGILAKWLATALAAEKHNLAPAWVWVDQDANAFGDVRYPVRTADGVLEARLWRTTPFLTGHQPVRGVPAFDPTAEPSPGDARYAAGEVGPALTQIRAALQAARTDAASAAEQLAGAALALLRPLTASTPRTFFATHLSRTDLFRELLDRMRADPRVCTDAYNAAVAGVPDGHAAEVTMLNTGVAHPRGAELPLWRIPRSLDGRPIGQRLRVHAADLPASHIDELAPRGLFMTGLLRLGACDLFIHGTGGGGPTGYDRITDLWFARWLGERIAPTAVVTADVFLDCGQTGPPPTTGDVAHARWLAHHARHHPSLLGDEPAETRKRRLVEAIAATPRRSPERALLFHDLHALLDRSRADHAGPLAALDHAAATAAAKLRNAPLGRDRSWPFPLYPADSLRNLRGAIADALL